MHDVAVIGAGVAGSATAIHLARLGRSVVLLDRAAFPRPKACGEGVFPAGVRELELLGALERLGSDVMPLTGIRFRAGANNAETALAGLGVQRERLDAALLGRAADHGVDVRTGVDVRSPRRLPPWLTAVDTTAGPVHARAFIAADGLHSPLRRAAGLDAAPAPGRRYGVTAHVSLSRAPEPLVDVSFADGREVYVTPVGGVVVNVAVLLGRDAMRAYAGRAAAVIDDALVDHPLLAGASHIAGAPAVAGPFPRRSRRAWRGNLVLVGDAAGFYDGISGEGISSALLGAHSAAVAVDHFLATGSDVELRAYDRLRRGIVRNSDLLARVTLALAARPWSARLAVRNLARRPATFERLVSINTGERGLTALRPRDLPALLAGI